MFLKCIELSLQTVLLGIEAQAVIGLRMKKIAGGGPGAVVEAQGMVAEKIAALAEAATTLVMGGSVQTVIHGYRTKVRANELRLIGATAAVPTSAHERRSPTAYHHRAHPEATLSHQVAGGPTGEQFSCLYG